MRRAPPAAWLYIASGLAAVAIALAAQQSGALTRFERMTVDARFGVRGAQPPDNRIVIVSVDQESLKQFNVQWPIPRARYAQVLDRLRAAHPRLIAMDVQLNGRSRDEAGDRALIASIARNGPVLLATRDTRTGPLGVLDVGSRPRGAALASAAVPTDADGVVRRMLFAPVALKTLPVRAAELYTGRPVSEAHFPGNDAWIAFRGPPGTFTTYSFIDVLQNKVPRSALQGKAVLVGVSDPAVKDVLTTPASDDPMAGVEVQANALATILEGFPLQRSDRWVGLLIVIALAAMPAAICARLGALPMLLASLAALGALLATVQLAFESGWIVPLLPAMLALALSAIGATAVDATLERRKRRTLEAALGDLLPPASPPAFFISYRREDEWPAHALCDKLAARFGDKSVFIDTASLRPGQAWPQEISDAVRGCTVLLALIGPSWLGVADADGSRRIDDPHDWVRREIEGVLRRPDAVVVPVLLNGATMPAAAVLPETLRPLADRQAVAIGAARLHDDIDSLIGSIETGRIHDHASVAAADLRTAKPMAKGASTGRFQTPKHSPPTRAGGSR